MSSITITKLMPEIPENTPIGTAVATISIDGLEEWPTLVLNQKLDATYKPYEDVNLFSIVGDKIVVANELNYEVDIYFSYDISVAIYPDTYGVGATFFVSDVAETIKGTNKADVIRGGLGADKILGMSGNDRLGGFFGEDTLYGGLGKDTLAGGSGEDTFLYKSIKESTVKDFDTILGWDHTGNNNPWVDTIDLSQIDANTKLAGNQDFAWLGAKEFTGHAGELRYERGAHSTMVYADVNGDGNADMAIRINDSVKMFAGDFIL